MLNISYTNSSGSINAHRMRVKHSGARNPVSSFKGLTEPPTVGHLREGLALLLALTMGLRRIAEGKNGQHIQAIRNA